MRLSTDEIFNAAAELADAAERTAFVEEACGGDSVLRAEIIDLLKHDDADDGLLDRSAPGLALALHEPTEQRLGSQIGPYKLLQQIGEGGMGVVYLAEQLQPVQRQVALKVIKPGMDSRQVIARFEAERQALALMDHPNIARVLDAGTVGEGAASASGWWLEGDRRSSPALATSTSHSAARPYFVMELVHGVPITQYCDDNKLAPRERLALFVPVCRAIEHAHQKGIIHRDIKPSNVLVGVSDGRPVPKVIDFGVAKAIEQKLTDQTLSTQIGTLVGTLEYMSPEQAELSPRGVDTRSDIYSLGVLLYELLTGTTPFDKQRLKSAGFDEIRRIIREEEPETVSRRLARTRRGDSQSDAHRATHGGHSPAYGSAARLSEIDWIVMRCLEKDRNRRYETASALAADVERYLADEPVLACPPTIAYRLQKFARRNRAAIVVAGGAFLALGVMAGSIGWAVRDRAARQAQSEQSESGRLQAVAGQVRDSFQAARALIAENELAAARAKLTLAKTQLGNDRERLSELAAEVDAGAAELDRLQKFLDLIDLAQQTETTTLEQEPEAAVLSESRQFAAAAKLLAEAVQLYSIPEHAGILDQPQVEQLRRHTYESLIGLANFVYHRQEDYRSGAKLAPRAAAKEAIVLLDKAATVRQPTHVLFVLRAACHETLSNAAAAQADRERAAQTPPSIAMDHVLRGRTAHLTRQMDEAVAAYEAALRLEPTHYWSLMLLGASLCDLGRDQQDLEEAARVFTGCILHRPDHAFAYRNRGVAQARLRRFAEALADYNRAIELEPTFAKAWYNRGLIYAELNQPEQALADYARAIELDPQDARAWNNRGGIYRAAGRLKEADAAFSKSISLDPDNALTWTNRGVARAQMNQRDLADADFSKAIALNPKLSRVWYGRGLANLKWGEPAKALPDLSKAIELDPKHAAAWDSRGQAHLRMALPGKAISDFRRVTELEPQNASAWYNLANAFIVVRQFERAVADYSKAIELDPKHISALNNRGAAYLKLNQPQKAVADCARAVELNPQDRSHWQTLGTAHYRAGDWAAAVTAFERSAELGQGGDSLDWHFLAMSQQQLGKNDEARQAFERAEQWLEKSQAALKQNVGLAEELRRIQAEAEEVLDLKPK